MVMNEQGEPTIEVTKDELLAVNNALNEVCHGFVVEPFQKRLGVNRQTARALLDALGEIYDRTPSADSSSDAWESLEGESGIAPLRARWDRDKGVALALGSSELSAIRNALLEVCAELEDWEFQTRMGCDRKFIRELLEVVGQALGQQPKLD